MAKKDPRIDAYIAKSADFARPILKHIRKLVHAVCPDVEETIKWQFPHFVYEGNLCAMAAFKQHCTFGFWNRLMWEALDVPPEDQQAMGQFGRITSLKDLPQDALFKQLIRRAVKMNVEGIKAPPTQKKAKKPRLAAPADLKAALAKNKKAKAAFDSFSPSHQREYIEWITEAKRDDTRQKRLATAIEWLSAGKSRNWKYENKKG